MTSNSHIKAGSGAECSEVRTRDTVEAIVAEMRDRARITPTGCTSTGPVMKLLNSYADRLQSAHDAEVGALRRWNESVAVCRDHTAEIVDAPCVVCRAESAESRLLGAERDASELRAAVAKTYAMIPGLPIEAETMDAATDALHNLCLTVGLFDIPVDGIDRAMEGEDG